jgi:GalNAc-alpha-(1->4)-GalNAc-alpha-(1->3)-diNAcBac-PP-undecaprenol alpha-1,4-N-acetyl-D-galactosaminyltransferase
LTGSAYRRFQWRRWKSHVNNIRLTLVNASLGRGGAERTASVLAGAWADRGAKVTLITLAQEDVPAYPLHSAIVLRQLKVRGGMARHIIHSVLRNLRIVRALRHAIRDSAPDVVIGFMDIPNVLAFLAVRGMNTPVIVTEHIHPGYYRIGWHWETLRRFVYRRADALVCVSTPLLDWFQSRIKVRGCVIPNPVDPAPLRIASDKKRDEVGAGHVIVGMGRLVEQKGFDLLIEAFSRVADRHSAWSLKIVGDGPLREQLERQTQEMNLEARVEFTGALADPFPVLRAADLFVFCSRYEGFGNALCEAMACGLPAISFDCPAGPSEIVRNGVDGLLVAAEDVTALSAAMDRLMTDGKERLKLAARAAEVVSRFGIDRVLGLWEHTFDDLLAQRSKMRSP